MIRRRLLCFMVAVITGTGCTGISLYTQQFGTGHWMRDSRTIVCTGYDLDTGISDLFAVDVFSGEAENITRSPSGEWDPVPSPADDIVVCSDGGNIVMIDIASGNRTILADSGENDSRPCWAPGGQTIYFNRWQADECSIMGVSVTGGDAWRVAGGNARDAGPSPDGKYLAWQGAPAFKHIWLLALDGSTEFDLCGDFIDAGQAAWSPASDAIAFMGVSRYDPQLDYEIYIYSIAEGTLRPLDANTVYESDPCWSPDGVSIYYGKGSGTSRDIAVRWVNGGIVTPVTNDQVEEIGISLSPDGKQLAFRDAQSGALFRCPAAGGHSVSFLAP